VTKFDRDDKVVKIYAGAWGAYFKKRCWGWVSRPAAWLLSALNRLEFVLVVDMPRQNNPEEVTKPGASVLNLRDNSVGRVIPSDSGSVTVKYPSSETTYYDLDIYCSIHRLVSRGQGKDDKVITIPTRN
jgi:hypothetical protein